MTGTGGMYGGSTVTAAEGTCGTETDGGGVTTALVGLVVAELAEIRAVDDGAEAWALVDEAVGSVPLSSLEQDARPVTPNQRAPTTKMLLRSCTELNSSIRAWGARWRARCWENPMAIPHERRQFGQSFIQTTYHNTRRFIQLNDNVFTYES